MGGSSGAHALVGAGSSRCATLPADVSNVELSSSTLRTVGPTSDELGDGMVFTTPVRPSSGRSCARRARFPDSADIDDDEDVVDGTRPGSRCEPESSEPPDLDVSLSSELLDNNSSMIIFCSASCAPSVWALTRAGHTPTLVPFLFVECSDDS